ncbi:MAG: FecR family protein [Cytophagaceae bacterium]|nr:MAG: FecR family protein [Cytophagaceae bacterium]
MKEYESYTIDDFVQDSRFRKWVLCQFPEQDDFWPTWLVTHPEQREAVEQARTIVLGLRVDDMPIDHLGVQEAIDRILSARQLVRPLPVYRRTWFQIAASIVLVCGVGLGVWQRFSPGPLSGGENTAYRTASPADKREVMTLPDGSTVTLEPGSQLTVSDDFRQKNREVTLIGEGFFDVTKDPSRPFLVNTGTIVTRVVGTSFRIKAYDTDTSISVSVKTGKVTVFRKRGEQEQQESAAVSLTPNQQAVYVRADEQFIKTLVEKPIIVNPSDRINAFDFNETPIPEVLNILTKAYGVTFVYNAETLASCNLTASLNRQDLYQKLDLICEAIHATYQVTDGQIMLSGRGCN